MWSQGYYLVKVTFILAVVNSIYCQGSPSQATFMNAAYGSDPRQLMDVYLPAGRSESTSKVIMLIHGGGWSGGSKAEYEFAVPFFQTNFPNYVIVNMQYRLGTVESPGFPKQIDDIRLAIQFLKSYSKQFQFKPSFGLVGNSAGAHLALLYGSGFDKSRDVKIICNNVGPTDLTEPTYLARPINTSAFFNLVGNFTYSQNPEIYRRVSPAYYINSKSPKTISFYGESDQIITIAQGVLLEDKLDSVGVYNKYYLYEGEGHGDWNPEHSEHSTRKLLFFFKNYF